MPVILSFGTLVLLLFPGFLLQVYAVQVPGQRPWWGLSIMHRLLRPVRVQLRCIHAGAALLFCQPVISLAHCSDRMLWNAPVLQMSNCSLPPSFLSRWTWTKRDGCCFRLFEWLHDFHLFIQTNPNPHPHPYLSQFMPNSNLNLTSILTLSLNLVPSRQNNEWGEQWAGPYMQETSNPII